MLYDTPLDVLSLKVSKYYNEHYSYYRMKEHSHTAFELMYVKNGKCRVICTDARTGKKTEYILSAGGYVYIYSGVVHDLIVERDNPCRILNLEVETIPRNGEFSLSCISGCEAVKRLTASAPMFAAARDDGSLYQMLSNIHERLYDISSPNNVYISEIAQNSSQTVIELSLAMLLVKLAEQLTSDAFSGSQAEAYVRRSRKYIQEHYDSTENITVSKIATYVNVSPAYLQRLFQKYSGTSMLEYINYLRLCKAKHLIERTDLGLVDIAVNSGFCSRQRMYQVFIKYEGISPGEYRLKCRNLEYEQS